MDRSVLIVTPFFAPQSHAAVFRAYKLARYLPRLGWKPFVLTTDVNYNYNEDPSLLPALPPEVEVVRARYVEPTLRGLRMTLGGRDRSFKALKAEGLIAARAPRSGPPEQAGLLARAGRNLRELFLNSPDAYWTWYGPAVRAARRLIRRHGIPLVLTSADPYTCHHIGLALQREGCKWVADLRDPHAYNHHTAARHWRVLAAQRALERAAATRADAVTVASSAIAMILTDMHGLQDDSRLCFIPTGLDEELLPSPGSSPPRAGRYLVFAGEYLPEYGAGFLEAFSAAGAPPGSAAAEVKLLFVGRAEVNGPLLRPHLDRLGLTHRVEILDQVPQRELYALLAGAEAGVLLTGPLSHWWCLHAKLVDYLAMKKPVLAMVPDPSEARTRLSRAGLGVFLDGGDGARAHRLADFLSGRLPPPVADADECARYTAGRQAEAFVGVFESLLKK